MPLPSVYTHLLLNTKQGNISPDLKQNVLKDSRKVVQNGIFMREVTEYKYAMSTKK